MKRADDAGVATVVGAILVLALLGLTILVVNSVYVPQQGATLEVGARERAEDALVVTASQEGSATTPFLAQLPLSSERPSPSLLPGIVLDPARADGRASFNASSTRVAIALNISGAPVYALGNATSGAPLGALTLRVGGAYLDPARYDLAGGMVLLARGGNSSVVAPPGLHVARGGSAASPVTEVAWRVPVLAGGLQEVSGKGAAQARLVPGPVAQSGGGDLVQNVTIRVETDALGAWTAALRDLVGANGVVAASPSGPADNGTVVATILPPAGTPSGASAVRVELSLVRYEVSLATRSAG